MRSAVEKDRARKILASLRSTTKQVVYAALDFIYPPACLFCGADIASLGPSAFCDGCRQALAPLVLDSCRRCGAPVGPYLETNLGCIHCRNTPFHFDRVLCLGVYKDELKSACRRIKSPHTEPLATALGEILWQRERDNLEAAKISRVFCVPHHWTRRLFRSHNASETLARLFAKRLGAKMEAHRIVKTRRTSKQATLPGSERRKNLRDAFRVRRPQTIPGQNILLVDDVLTTGTTANRICRLLRKAGANTITVAVLARGLGEHH